MPMLNLSISYSNSYTQIFIFSNEHDSTQKVAQRAEYDIDVLLHFCGLEQSTMILTPHIIITLQCNMTPLTKSIHLPSACAMDSFFLIVVYESDDIISLEFGQGLFSRSVVTIIIHWNSQSTGTGRRIPLLGSHIFCAIDWLNSDLYHCCL